MLRVPARPGGAVVLDDTQLTVRRDCDVGTHRLHPIEDHDALDVAGVVLTQDRLHGASKQFGPVARGHDSGDRRPADRLLLILEISKRFDLHDVSPVVP